MFGKPWVDGELIGPLRLGGCSGGEPAPGLKALPRRRRRKACGQDSVLVLWKVYSVFLLSNSPIIGQFVFVSEQCRGVLYILLVM